MDKRSAVLRLAEEFKEREGRFPSRIDWRGRNLAHYREKHGLDYPSERQVQRLFGNWGMLLVALGLPPRRTQDVADIALNYVLDAYEDVEVMPGASGTIDCFVEGERTEVKGASLRTDDYIRTPRWRFRLHGREYSRIVDRLILVGLVGEEPVVEWSLDKVGVYLEADGKDALSIPAKFPFDNLSYNLSMYERWKAPLTLEELLSRAEEAGELRGDHQAR